ATSPSTVRQESLAQSRCTLHGDALYIASCYQFTGTTKPNYLPYLVKIHREFPNAIPIDCSTMKSPDHQKAVQVPVCDMCESSIQARMSRYGE
ncbi:hypothetical protein SIK65_18985, partial [Clostridioides difficile]|uniref:hypothetical protein n=1 Tax=Clostridioides difficile TaxID=1496 RepID=UPI0029C56FA4